MIVERIVEIGDKGLYVADKEYIVRCEHCVHCHEDVWAEDIGLNDWAGLIVGHWACDFWGKDWCQTKPDGFCNNGDDRRMSNAEVH